MRPIAVLGTLFLALVALLAGLVFWAVACATIVLPVLERSPIRFRPDTVYLGLLFFMATAFAGTILIAAVHEVVGWVVERAIVAERLLEHQDTPSLGVVQGGKTSPPSA